MHAIRAVPSCPLVLRSLLDDPTDDAVNQVSVRLLCNLEMDDVWRRISEASSNDAQIIRAWMAMLSRVHIPAESPAFSKLTNRQRLIWLDEARQNTARMRKLLSEGPRLSAENLLSVFQEECMKRFLGTLGVRVVPGPQVPSSEIEGHWVIDEWTLSRAMNGLPGLFELDDVLSALEDELRAGVQSTGSVSKPRDAKAARANYILTVTSSLANCLGRELPDETIAALVRVALEDDTVTPSLVNRFRSRNQARELIGGTD